MAESYDVVVVGGGLGGLAAAAKMAREGLSVRLLERHAQPGGYATTFYRDPFEFEVSLHELSGIGTEGNRGSLWAILEDLGVTERVEFLQVEPFFRSVADGVDLRVPTDRRGAVDALCEAFPDEARGLTRVMEQLFAIKAEADRMGEELDAAPSVWQAITHYPLVSHAAATPLSKLLYREVQDPAARMALAQPWSYFGLPPSELSLVLFAGAMSVYLTHGAAYPRCKSQGLSNALAEAIEQAGGRVSLATGAQRILLDDGAVSGVITDRGEHLEAGTVVSNATPHATFWDLVGAEHLPQKYLHRVATSPASVSVFTVYLGLCRSAEDLGMRDHEVFFNRTHDLEQQYRDAFDLTPPGTFLATAYNASDPTFSPPGTSVVSLCCVVDGRTWLDVPPEAYGELKMSWAESMVRRADQLYPGLAAAVQTTVTSSPVTNLRYTGNLDGAVYGYAMTPAQNPVFRLGQSTPIDGLWLAGAWTQPGGGFQPTITSGFDAACGILRTRGIDLAVVAA